jgi:hypothetical protein
VAASAVVVAALAGAAGPWSAAELLVAAVQGVAVSAEKDCHWQKGLREPWLLLVGPPLFLRLAQTWV